MWEVLSEEVSTEVKGEYRKPCVWKARKKVLTQSSGFQKRVKSANMGHLF